MSKIKRVTNAYANIEEFAEQHNEKYISEAMVREKVYLDNILKSVDPIISLDEDQHSAEINFMELPIETLKSFTYKEDKAISRFVDQLNEGVDDNIYKKLSYKPITQWLKLNGFLQEENNLEFKKTITMPTQKGIQLGIRAERRNNSRGMEYILLIYGKQAQEYIFQNLERILCGEVAE